MTRSKYEASFALKTLKQTNLGKGKSRVPQYLKNTKGAVKIQKENKGGLKEEVDKPLKMVKQKDISQMSKLELERLLHMKGRITRH